MSQETNFNPFAVNDTDDALKAKVISGVFGLNPAVNVAEVKFSDKDKDGNTAYSVMYDVQVDEKSFKRFLNFNPGEKVFVKGEKDPVGPDHEGYAAAYGADLAQKIGVVKHILKAVGVTQTQIDNTVSQIDQDNVPAGVKMLIDLLPEDYSTKKVDLFLEYQWNIKNDKDGKSLGRTFLEMPNNMKGGIFLIPAVVPTGKWNQVISEEGELSYVDNAGSTHPFTRTKNYMESNRAKEQTTASVEAEKTNGFNASAGKPTDAKKSTWG